MPLYEYECGQCGGVFEHLARTTSDRPENCPRCGSPDMRKRLSVFATTSGTPDLSSCSSGVCSASSCSTGSCPWANG